MAKTAKEKAKRGYNKNPIEKLKQGKKWSVNFDVDEDVATCLIKEKQGAPDGAQYSRIINNRLRKSYGLKAKKAA